MEPQSQQPTFTASELAWQALVKVMNSKPWFDKFFHSEAHQSLDILAQYISANLQKEKREVKASEPVKEVFVAPEAV